MKNTRKILIALLVLMTLMVSVFAVTASAVKTTAPTTLYLSPNSNWKQDNPRYAVYTWDGGDKWFDMADTNGDGVYEVTIPAGIENIIFCRMNPATTANNWNNKWNQTSDLKYDSTKNHYTVAEGAWDKGAGTWSLLEVGQCIHSASTAGTVIKAPTCTENGETSHATCSKCGEAFVEITAATGHKYGDNGKCSVCSAIATYTIAGTGAHLGTPEWSEKNAANDMSYDAATGTYTKVYTNVAAGTYKFKCAQDHDWNVAYPDQDKSYTVAVAGSTVTITLKGKTVDVKVDVPTGDDNCDHNWTPATCTAPKTCSKCNLPDGDPLGHSFGADGKCSACGYAPLYIVAGDVMTGGTGTNFLGTSWDIANESNKLVYNVTTGLFEKTYSDVKVGEYNVKIALNKSWDISYGDKGGADDCYIKVEKDNSTVTVTFDPKTCVPTVTVTATEAPAHVNALVVGDTNKIVVSGNTLNAYNLPIEWVLFTADENAFYSFVGDNGALAYIFSADGTALVSATGAANLEVGNYLVCLGNGLVGEFNVAVTKSAWVNALAIGDNKLLITDALDNGAGYYIVWVSFEVTEKANYTFTGEGILALVYDAAYGAVTGTELDVGTYNICVAFLTPATTGVAPVTVTKTAIGGEEPPVVEDPALVLGENTVVIDGTQTNLTGNAIVWYTFTPEVAGTYTFTSDLTVYILTVKNMGDVNAYVGNGGVAELEAGTKYFILLGKEGVKGEFAVTVSAGGEVVAKNALVLGDNEYNLTEALKKVGAEYLQFTATKTGWYTFHCGDVLNGYTWYTVPDISLEELANYGATIPWAQNFDFVTGLKTDSFTAYFEEGKTYWVAFNFDAAEPGKYDISVSYSETDPNAADDPGCDNPSDTQPDVELSLVDRIIKMITDFFAQIINWFKNLIPATKE